MIESHPLHIDPNPINPNQINLLGAIQFDYHPDDAVHYQNVTIDEKALNKLIPHFEINHPYSFNVEYDTDPLAEKMQVKKDDNGWIIKLINQDNSHNDQAQFSWNDSPNFESRTQSEIDGNQTYYHQNYSDLHGYERDSVTYGAGNSTAAVKYINGNGNPNYSLTLETKDTKIEAWGDGHNADTILSAYLGNPNAPKNQSNWSKLNETKYTDFGLSSDLSKIKDLFIPGSYRYFDRDLTFGEMIDKLGGSNPTFEQVLTDTAHNSFGSEVGVETLKNQEIFKTIETLAKSHAPFTVNKDLTNP